MWKRAISPGGGGIDIDTTPLALTRVNVTNGHVFTAEEAGNIVIASQWSSTPAQIRLNGNLVAITSATYFFATICVKEGDKITYTGGTLTNTGGVKLAVAQ